MNTLKKVAIVGAGMMGAEIALSFQTFSIAQKEGSRQAHWQKGKKGMV